MSTYAGNRICSVTYNVLRIRHAESVSKLFKGRPKSESQIKLMSEQNKGVVPWHATNAAAAANKGRKLSPERRAKIAGENNWNYGSGVCSIPLEARARGSANVSAEKRRLRAFGKYWWTNGIKDLRSKDQPEGFYRGRSNHGN